MKIRYTRSGGLANITTRAEIDSKKLPKQKATEIENLVSDARVFHQPTESERESPTADDLQHDLEIEDGRRHHRICRHDSQCTPELLRLFDHLHQEALAQLRRR